MPYSFAKRFLQTFPSKNCGQPIPFLSTKASNFSWSLSNEIPTTSKTPPLILVVKLFNTRNFLYTRSTPSSSKVNQNHFSLHLRKIYFSFAQSLKFHGKRLSYGLPCKFYFIPFLPCRTRYQYRIPILDPHYRQPLQSFLLFLFIGGCHYFIKLNQPFHLSRHQGRNLFTGS